jgi:hypothetical protein
MMSEPGLSIVARDLHWIDHVYLIITGSVLSQVLPSFFVPTQVLAPETLLYPHSEQLTPSIGMLGMDGAMISDPGYPRLTRYKRSKFLDTGEGVTKRFPHTY